MDLPSIPGKLFYGMALRQQAGHGSLDDVEINITSTAGLGGMSLFVEVAKPCGKGKETKTVYVQYDLVEYIEQIAQAIIDADWKDLEEKK